MAERTAQASAMPCWVSTDFGSGRNAQISYFLDARQRAVSAHPFYRGMADHGNQQHPRRRARADHT
ncbi:hypothetical protein, partial [Variovorax sp. 22077]|uniref:hypothetical protein n=1 Tax=Variovorax sp. 22077 TaxID=3453867 RepID=UPI003F84E250